jgi:hypothetical protein
MKEAAKRDVLAEAVAYRRKSRAQRPNAGCQAMKRLLAGSWCDAASRFLTAGAGGASHCERLRASSACPAMAGLRWRLRRMRVARAHARGHGEDVARHDGASGTSPAASRGIE